MRKAVLSSEHHLIIILFVSCVVTFSSSALARPINPERTAVPSDLEIDSFFRIAFHSALAGDYDTAIINYRRAAESATDACDQQHAEFGIEAASEAKKISLETDANRSDVSTRRFPVAQQFWYRLRTTALPLECVDLRY